MIAAVLFVSALVGTAHVYGVNEGKSCTFTLQKDLDPKKEPLVLSVKKTEIRNDDNGLVDDIEVESLDIARPEVVDGKGVITVDSGHSLMFACPGKRNYNPVTRKQTAYANCKDGKLTINNRPVNVKTDSCTHMYAESWLRISHKTCGSGEDTGVVLQLGFMLDDDTFFSLVEICHNITRSVTFYTNHALYGHSLRGGVKSSMRKKFSRGPKSLFPDVNPDRVYPKKGQEAAFKKIFGENKYISDKAFLARGHLSPDADFIYNSGQLMTYYYANVAPQWQDFNAGNWLTVENTVRALAQKEDQTMDVYTGTYGVLNLKDASGNAKPIYLDPKNELIPAPELYWKLVQHPVTRDCTVAVGVNNIFLDEAPTPICKAATPDGWPELHDLKKGYTYYCDYESFNETIPYLPHLECKGLLEFPETQ